MNRRSYRATQQGSMLLEALISVLIFSMGILALVGMQAASVNNVTDAKYRSDAAFLADQIIGEMWVDRANLANYSYPGGNSANLISWVTQVNGLLPGSTTNPPTIAVVNGAVTVTLFWQPPSATARHSHVAIANISNQ